jgi:hypothetical protein
LTPNLLKTSTDVKGRNFDAISGREHAASSFVTECSEKDLTAARWPTDPWRL